MPLACPAPRAVAALALIVSVTILAPLRAQATCSEPLFNNGIETATGYEPRGGTVGDFNEDGILDLAIAHNGPNAGGSVGILLGLGTNGVGNGSFGSPARFVAGSGSFSIAAADFNGDGHLDLAVTNAISNNLSILIGNGNGTFAAHVDYAAGGGPYGLAVADFNEDGILDLAVADNIDPTIAVLIGNGSGGVGNGTFSAPSIYGLPQVSTGIVAADFDEDGILDLAATCNYLSKIAIFKGHGAGGVGDGTFNPATTIDADTEPFALAAADLDGDGHVDLISGDAAFGGVAVFHGAGAGGFPTATPYRLGTQNAGIVVGDFNDDGVLDFATGDGRNNVMTTFIGQSSGGQPTGTFNVTTSYPAGATSFPLASGDFNEDGAVDLVVLNFDGGGVSTFRGLCGVAPPPGPEPALTSVRDVPHDQGGRVFVTWLASSFDTPPIHTVTGYRVWRRIPPEGTLRSAIASLGSALPGHGIVRMISDAGAVTYWEALIDLPAQQLEGYGYTAPTTQDSMHFSNPYTAFFVTALTSNPAVFYNSQVDSGYSVDNLPPHGPNNLVGSPDPAGYRLSWDAVSDPDVSTYRVYRGDAETFPCDDAHRIAEPTDVTYVDPGMSGADLYKVSTVDVHGNEGPASLLPAAPLAVGDAASVFALLGALPNPGRPDRLEVAFSLPAAGKATLELYDVRGRRVAGRDVGNLGAGSHRVDLARDVRIEAGVYWIRLTRAARVQTLRALVIP